MSPNRPGAQSAARHELRARNYRRQAERLLEQYTDLDSAGALLYESAKQCINAIANQQGLNPVSTGAKRRFLRSLAEEVRGPSTRMQAWRSVETLHIHADRGHLARQDFLEAWTNAQAFIDQMLLIYRAPE